MLGRRLLQSNQLVRQPVPFFSSTIIPSRSLVQTPRTTPSTTVFHRLRSTWHDPEYDQYLSQVDQKKTILWTLIGLNTAVFAGWLASGESTRSAGTPGSRRTSRLSKFMRENFLLSPLHLKAKHYWTILTCNISHIDPMHFLGNMFSLFAFSSVLVRHPAVGTSRFLALILGSAVASSAGDIWHRAQTKQMGFSLGASGVVMGLGASAACLAPRTTFLLFGIVPAPLWVLVPGYFVLDLYYLDNQNSRVGHAAHLGGGAFGILYYLYLVGLRRGRF